jgi:glutaredoxin
MNTVNVYGTDWCEDTQMTRDHLGKLDIPYQYINIEQDQEACTWVKQVNRGKQKTPTVDIDGHILVEPDNAALEKALRANGLLD